MTRHKSHPLTESPVCRCGDAVGRDDIIYTRSGSYVVCQSCWASGRRRWFRPDTKAERIAALERSVSSLESA
jgi:hypothetical protein